MAKYTRDDILDMIEEEDIEFIRLQFTDIAGNLKNMATTVDQIDKILDEIGKMEGKVAACAQNLLFVFERAAKADASLIAQRSMVLMAIWRNYS